MKKLIEWPIINDSWSKEKKEKILKDREEITKNVDFLYSDRSVIKLKKYRPTEKRVFLNLSAFCITCKKKKKLWRFYNEESDSINNSCELCQQKQEIYDILGDII